MGSLQCLKLHQAARSAWGLGRSPILKLKEALKDILRLMFLDRFQQLLEINQRFLSPKVPGLLYNLVLPVPAGGGVLLSV